VFKISLKLLYAFFWVISRRLNFICRRFGTLSSKMEQSVPKRQHIIFRRRRITQKKAYNIQNTAKVWNQKSLKLPKKGLATDIWMSKIKVNTCQWNMPLRLLRVLVSTDSLSQPFVQEWTLLHHDCFQLKIHGIVSWAYRWTSLDEDLKPPTTSALLANALLRDT
jgi:hypothetical protein